MKMFHGLKQSIVDGIRKNPTTDSATDKFLGEALSGSQTILFSDEQAKILLEVTSTYTDTLDYRLPFESLFLQFSAPIPVTTKTGDNAELCCLLLLQSFESEKPDANVINSIWGWYKHTLSNPMAKVAIYAWDGKESAEAQLAIGDQEYDVMRAFAIACIGYINCENIYLHREATPAAVNRKRERDGKKILDPYYVCRIQGVQYDGDGNIIGEAMHHGFRYDVRGHFRKLATDRTIWVRPHQRGLQNELYVPKVYIVPTEAQ